MILFMNMYKFIEVFCLHAVYEGLEEMGSSLISV